jgi:hypothetical protein
MDTDAETPRPEIPHEIDRLMRLLANLNAGAMLALCLWLASSAMDFNARQTDGAGEIRVQDCGCTLTGATNWSGRLDVAARD